MDVWITEEINADVSIDFSKRFLLLNVVVKKLEMV